MGGFFLAIYLYTAQCLLSSRSQRPYGMGAIYVLINCNLLPLLEKVRYSILEKCRMCLLVLAVDDSSTYFVVWFHLYMECRQQHF